MNNSFVLTVDNFFTKKECKDLLKTYKVNLKLEEKLGYLYNEIIIQEFKFLDKLLKLINLYKKTYPEVDMTASGWALTNLRFKLFKKGKSFKNFHSEVNLANPTRLLSLQVYLTEHECGTEFFRDKKVIKSKAGRACLFPAYFTHTHKGQPDFKKERCIITGYYSFCKKGMNEIN